METYTIQDLSRMFSLPASTLRYYEAEGLLVNVERTPEKQRLYSERHVKRLDTIRCFKGTGMSIAQLRAFFEYERAETENVDRILELLRDQREHVLEEMEQMRENLEHVERKIQRFEALKVSLDRADGRE